MKTTKHILPVVLCAFALLPFGEAGRGYAQSRMVINNGGYLVIDNGAYLVIDNAATTALAVAGTGGNIKSESIWKFYLNGLFYVKKEIIIFDRNLQS